MFHSSLVCCYLYPITRYGYPPPANETLKHLSEMKALGFQSVELEGIHGQHLIDMYEQREVIKETIHELELEIPYFCTVLPGLSSADATVREKNLKLFEKGCEIASLLGSKGVLDNGPLPPYQFPEDIPVTRHYDENVLLAASIPPHLTWDIYWKELVQIFQTVCDIAASYQLTYQVHPCLGVLCSNTDGFLYFQDAVARENLRFNVDVANQYAMKDNPLLALRRVSEYIDYIHVSDNRGDRIEHLPLQVGAIQWDPFFETLQLIDYKGHIGLDIGGAETEISDLDQAYKDTANYIESKLSQIENIGEIK